MSQSLVDAISQVRFENGKTPSVVRQFLIDQLRYNDNTSNPVSVSTPFALGQVMTFDLVLRRLLYLYYYSCCCLCNCINGPTRERRITSL